LTRKWLKKSLKNKSRKKSLKKKKLDCKKMKKLKYKDHLPKGLRKNRWRPRIKIHLL
jgi:hypothetical protein